MTTPATPSPTNNHQRRRWLTLLALVFLSIGLLCLAYWFFIGQYHANTDDAYVSGNLVQVMPQISGQVTSILAEETDLVKKGQPVILLDQADTHDALLSAESQLAVTVRQVSQLYQNVNQLEANVTVQQEALQKAQDDYQRRADLKINQQISAEEVEHAKIALDSATAALTLAKTQLNAAIALVKNTDLYHHPQVQQAADNVRNAYLAWQRTVIYASETGYVAKRPVQVGQDVTPNTILMIIVPLNQIWVNANFKESELRNIRIGQPVKLISDVYGSDVTYHGVVVGLSPGTGSVFDLLPPQNATGNWIKIVQRLPVRIQIDPKQLVQYPLRIGFSMTVTVDTHNRRGQTLSQVAEHPTQYQTEDYSSNLKQAEQLIDKILRENSDNLTYTPTP